MLHDEDQDAKLNDLCSEPCLPNSECGDVIDTRENMFPFPEMDLDGLRRNLVLAGDGILEVEL